MSTGNLLFVSSEDSVDCKPSKADILRGLVADKLTTAAQEILAVVERTVAGYEEEAAGLRQEVERQRKHLELLLQPQVTLCRIDDQIPVCDPVAGGVEVPEESEQHKYEPSWSNIDGMETSWAAGGCVNDPLAGDRDAAGPLIGGGVENLLTGGNDTEDRLRDVKDLESQGILCHAEEEESEDVGKTAEEPGRSTSRNQEDLRVMDHQIPNTRSQPVTRNRRSLGPTVHLRVCLLKDSHTEVLKKGVLKSPMTDLRCPRGLQEPDFLDLLRSTFPQLTGQFDVFTTDGTKTLTPLKVRTLTPEEIKRSIKLRSALYISTKKAKKTLISTEQLPPPQRKDEATNDMRNYENGPHASSVEKVENDAADRLSIYSRWQQQIEREDDGERGFSALSSVRPAAESEGDNGDYDDDDEVNEDDRDDDWKPNKNDEELRGSDAEQDSSKTTTEKQGERSGVKTMRRKWRQSSDDSDAPLSCKVCRTLHGTMNMLIKHSWSHMDDPERLCGVCGEHSESAEELRSHLESHQKIHNDKEDSRSLDILGHTEEEEGEDEGEESAEDPDYQTQNIRDQPVKRIYTRRGLLSLKVCLLKDTHTDVLKKGVLKCPMRILKCPRALQEPDFLDLLRSTFPQLTGQFDLFTTDGSKKLTPLNVRTWTPEEIKRSIKSALYISTKRADKYLTIMEQQPPFTPPQKKDRPHARRGCTSDTAAKIREKLRTGDAKVEHKVNQRSKAWDRFGRIVLSDDTITDYVICLSCDTLYKYDGHKTGTSNLNRHSCSGSAAPQAPSNQPLVSSFIKDEVPHAAKSEVVDGVVDFRCSRNMADKIREKLRTGAAKVQHKLNRRSKVWERFGQVVLSDDTITGYVICFSCDTLYKYDGHKTGTSNLNRHSCSGPAAIQVRGPTQQAPPYQPLVSAFMKNEVPGAVKSEFVDGFVDFYRSDLGPFDVGSGEGFTNEAQGLINIGAHYGAVDANSIIPHRQTICDRAKEQANKDKASLCRTINKALEYGIGITTDMWTDSPSLRSYTVLTCHYITDDWKLLSQKISTVEFDSRIEKTATNIHEQISKELSEVGISADGLSKVVLVSDQGPNIKAALESYVWIPCAVHVISTILKRTFEERDAPDFMQEVMDQIVKCMNLVTYLKKSGNAFSFPHSGLQESETRWTSKAVMLHFVAKQHKEILELLRDKGQVQHMEGIQVEVLNTLVEFLSPFKDALEDMEGDRCPTINTVLLWHHKLKGHCEPRCRDPRYMQHIRSRAGVLLNETFMITTTHKIATFLSPRFKTLKMLPLDERSAVQAEARRLTAAFIPTLQAQSEQTSPALTGETSASRIPSEEALEEPSLKRRRLFSEWEDTPGLIEPDEVQRYLETHFTIDECQENVLDFWRDRRSTFPLLSKLARAVLCIPATSVSNERTLSSDGRVLDGQRDR